MNATTTSTDSTRIRLSHDWRFAGPVALPGATDLLNPDVVAAQAATDLDDSRWHHVSLPHTVVPLSWQRWNAFSWDHVWAYRRRFETPAGSAGNRTFIDFDGAMTSAVVTLNDTLLGNHRGGYLPFSFEITDHLSDTGNTLGVLLDSRFNQNVPPNLPHPAPATSIDYWQPGGIHRDVSLRIVPRTFISSVATTHHDVLDDARRRSTFVVTVDSKDGASDVVIKIDLIDATRTTVGSSRHASATVGAGLTDVTIDVGDLAQIELWDTESPVLYTVTTSLEIADEVVHTSSLRTGYREARWEKNGFFLNGERRYLLGVNRHSIYPYTGFSMPDRVQRRDAEIIKNELNCNFVRCSHYPQTASFLDACDELGLLVWEEPPAWQYVGDSDWQDAAVEALTEMIARDRHRPSIVVWGARLNETPDRPVFYARTEKLVKELDPTRATSGTMHRDYTRTATFQHDVFGYDDYYTRIDEDGERRPDLLPPVEDRPYLLSEALSSRSSPTTLYRRIEHASVQQHQALDYANGHNDAMGDERYSGLIAWVAFDYQAGFGNHFHGVKTSGLADSFRILKPGAAMYRAQISSEQRRVVEPAFTWDPPEIVQVRAKPSERGWMRSEEDLKWGPGAKAIIFSNLDRLEVFLGSTSLGTVQPDTEHFPHLPVAPSFVDLTLEQDPSSDLRIDGYLGDELVITRRFAGDRFGDGLELTPDDTVLTADGVDATRVVVAVVDRFGERRGHSRAVVELDITGPGVLIGENPFDLEDSGAVGAVWIRTIAGEPGDIIVRAFTDTFGVQTATITSVVDTQEG